MRVQQAIFTSAQTARGEGYHVVAASPDVDEADAQTLALWCPSHGALLADGPAAQSVQFHRLPGGAYCIARTRPIGAEYSGRRGPRLHTHCLIVEPETLLRFANNPFAVLQAAVASGALAAAEADPEQAAEPLALVGRASAVQTGLVEHWASLLGTEQLAGLLDAVLSVPQCAVRCELPYEELFAALLNCLPVECRTEITLATGLRYSPQRPFGWNPLGGDAQEQQRLERNFDVRVIEAARLRGEEEGGATWGQCVATLLATQGVAALAAQLTQPRPGLTCGDLVTLAQELAVQPAPAAVPNRVAHAAHVRTTSASAAGTSTLERPAQTLATENPAVLEQLETLDDAVFEAMSGRPEALARVETLWPHLQTQLAPEMVDESRVQYLRYALGIWEDYLQADGSHDRALAALEVLCLLFDE